MSREVQVTGLNMTATVPEDLQISLGKLAVTGTPDTPVSEANAGTYSLASSTGVLYAASGVAGDGKAVAPANSWDWSNTADISSYYAFGKLMPASSTTGETIYYTPDATGVGRSVSGIAKYYAANSALAAWITGGTAAPAANATDDIARATLHAYTSANDKTDAAADNKTSWKSSTYEVASAWNVTNDDGYYVDIPVWIRSSGSEDIHLRVDGYVLPGDPVTGGNTETELELYRAVRVAILNGEDKTGGGKATTTNNTTTYADVTGGTAVVAGANILPLVDAWDKANSTGYNANASDTCKYTAIATKTTPFALPANDTVGILDSAIYTERLGLTSSSSPIKAGELCGVSALGDYTDTEKSNDLTGYIAGTAGNGVKATYAKYTQYTTNTEIATIKCPANSGDTYSSTKYGEPKKLVIRVWLDGEDEQCWNDNAGQDWKISLNFSKVTS